MGRVGRMFCFGKRVYMGEFSGRGESRGGKGKVEYIEDYKEGNRKTVKNKTSVESVRPRGIGGVVA